MRNFGGNWYKQTNANDLDHMTSAVKGFNEKIHMPDILGLGTRSRWVPVTFESPNSLSIK